MFVDILIYLVIIFIMYFLYVYKKIHYFYEKRGIKYVPGVPIFGNLMRSTCMKAHVWEDFDAVYRAFPDEKYIGFIEGTTPTIMIRDPEIIKCVTIKHFDHFVNHKKFFPEDTIFGNSLLMLKDDKWRDMRTVLSPAFTCSKMRLMVPFMVDISNNIVEYLKEHLSEDIDAVDLMRRYTNDVIASTCFGLQINSLIDKDNDFYKCGQTLFDFTLSQRIGLFMHAQFPNFSKKIGVRVVPTETEHFFTDIVASTMDYRLKNNIRRPDMIQLMMEVSKEWSNYELAAQVFIFFVAGFETTSNALIMCIHELALNPNVQEKLYQELKTYTESKEDFKYENVNEIKYLDCVLNEASRKWAGTVVVDRICTKSYELPPLYAGGKPYEVKPGDLVYNAANSIHMDPKHYPNPEVFDPDRFLDENKHNVKFGTFMPYGIGPRVCVGARLAVIEMKVLLYQLVLNYKILKCKKTMDPIRLQPFDTLMKAKDGSWVKFQARY